MQREGLGSSPSPLTEGWHCTLFISRIGPVGTCSAVSFLSLIRSLATTFPTFVTPLAPLLLPYTFALARSCIRLAGFLSSRRLPCSRASSFVHQSRCIRMLPFSPHAWPVRWESLGLKRSDESPTTLPQGHDAGLHSSLLRAYSSPHGGCFSQSYGKSPAGPVCGSVADGDLV